jgi:L-alanine-DL-glutamate epimerase-like enolase superfamily enzyme
MFGGMVETRLAMGCSLALALGLGETKFLDLDTPLLLSEDPLHGGYEYQGPKIKPCKDPGLGSFPSIAPRVFAR